MSEVTTNAAASAAAVSKKVNRRGIASARGVERLKFSHEMAQPNGLFVAHLDKVEVRKITIGEDASGMPSFNGMDIPQLVLTFASNEPELNKRHYVTLRFSAVESNVETIPGGKSAWKVDSVLDWTKHILDTFVFKGRDLTEEEEIAYSLPFEDFDEQGEYASVDPQVVIDGWTSLFENIANALNNGADGKAVYEDKNGKPISIWIKLLRYTKVNNKKKGSYWTPITNGELAFPTFVGEGCIEILKQNVPASIRLNGVKEAIIPMKVEKPKAPNMPTPGVTAAAPMMGGVPLGVDPMAGGFGGGDIAGAALADDMPF